jgi:tetratricopeptide (TPR) repeat protein
MFRVFCLFLISLLPAAGCIWDRDTWREEAKGRIDTLKAITGWFDRYPPRYYEMRLERVTKELEANPQKLNLYDDAGVACNRLGRYDEAIAWMAKKKAVLDAIPGTSANMDRYRYHANLGSFLGNRWATRPAAERNADFSDLKEATEHIADAISLNPDAHFGREKYQLKLFQWLLKPGGEDLDGNFLGLYFFDDDRRTEAGGLNRYPELEDAESALTGLIHLGSAWESIDVFEALRATVQADGASSLALLASFRLGELTDEGHKSLHPSEDRNWDDYENLVPEWRSLKEWYQETRSLAKKREATWIAYQSERFDRGMHPDTHPDFWRGWKEPKFPELPNTPMTRGEKVTLLVYVVAGLIITAIGLFIGLKWKKAKGRKRVLAFP